MHVAHLKSHHWGVLGGGEVGGGPRSHRGGELRRRGSRGGQERGLHLHQEAAAPSRCPLGGRQRQGGCNLHRLYTPPTTAAPAGAAPKRGNADLHWGDHSHLPGRPEPEGRPAANVRRCGTSSPNEGTAHRLQVPAAGQREASRRQKGVPGPRAGRDSSTIDQPLGLTAAHGEKARRHVAALRRLPPTEQRDGAGHLPGTEYARFRLPRSRVYLLPSSQNTAPKIFRQ